MYTYKILLLPFNKTRGKKSEFLVGFLTDTLYRRPYDFNFLTRVLTIAADVYKLKIKC